MYSKTGGKVLFQNSIQKSMGIDKTTAFPLYTRLDFVTRKNPIYHVEDFNSSCKQRPCFFWWWPLYSLL